MIFAYVLEEFPPIFAYVLEKPPRKTQGASQLENLQIG
jgi:hypothetical protein